MKIIEIQWNYMKINAMKSQTSQSHEHLYKLLCSSVHWSVTLGENTWKYMKIMPVHPYVHQSIRPPLLSLPLQVPMLSTPCHPFPFPLLTFLLQRGYKRRWWDQYDYDAIGCLGDGVRGTSLHHNRQQDGRLIPSILCKVHKLQGSGRRIAKV